MSDVEQQKYINDPRIPCKYGVKCYQKNPNHHNKYKHPPKNKDDKQKHIIKKRKIETKNKVRETAVKQDSDSDNYAIEDDSDSSLGSTNKLQVKKVNHDVSESDSESEVSKTKKGDNDVSDTDDSNSENEDAEDNNSDKKHVQDPVGSKNEEQKIPTTSDDTKSNKTSPEVKIADIFKRTNNVKQYSEHADFIKEKFLVEMPHDFYHFWDFCKILKPNNPLEALKGVGLTLVGPFDVLAGKFVNSKKSDDEFLIHWRYYRDPPEFQTVLKGDDKIGFHIGYFRDSPTEKPVFLCSNQSEKDGILTAMGENIFAAVNFYLEDLKKSGDPFKKMQIGNIQPPLKREADKLNYNLSKKTNDMVTREKKIVTRSFNKIGLVVPVDKKNDVGYRELALDNKALNILLTKLQNAQSPEQRSKFRSELQPVFTYASIAADECDFGTSIELGWNLMAHGIESLNEIILDFLTTGYQLLDKPEFAKIAEAHLKNRKKGCALSIL